MPKVIFLTCFFAMTFAGCAIDDSQEAGQFNFGSDADEEFKKCVKESSESISVINGNDVPVTRRPQFLPKSWIDDCKVMTAKKEWRLYQNYLNVTDLMQDSLVTHLALEYSGRINYKNETYQFVNYSYIWKLLPNNSREMSKLLVFDREGCFIGYYKTYGTSVINVEAEKLSLFYDYETGQNQRTFLNFSSGIPKSDAEGFGCDFESLAEIIEGN